MPTPIQKIALSIITVSEMIEHIRSGYMTGPPLKTKLTMNSPYIFIKYFMKSQPIY
jgi:hypothetical protein